MATKRKIEIVFAGDTSNLEKATGKVKGFTSKLGGLGKGIASVAGGIGVANLAGKAFGFLTDSMHDAADEQEAVAKLGKVMQNVGISPKAQQSVEDWISKTQNATGVMDDELRPAMSKLLSAGVPLAKAQQLLGQGLDISAAKGKPLGTVVDALAKGYNGNVGALGKLTGATKDAQGNTLTFEQQLKRASKTMGGAAQAAAGTTAGKMRILKARFADLKENIGAKLLPIFNKLIAFLMDKVVPAVQAVADWVGRNSKVIIPLVAALAAAAAAFRIGAIAVGIFNAVMEANPIVLVITALVALGAGLVVAYNKVGWFRDFVDAAWRTIKTGAHALWTGVKWAWENVGRPVISAVGTIIKGLWDNVLHPTFDAVKTVFHAVWTGAKTAWDTVGSPIFSAIKTTISTVWGPVKTAISGVGDVFSGLGGIFRTAWSTIGTIAGWFKSAWNHVKDAFNTVKDALITGIREVGSAFQTAYDNSIGPVVEGITDAWGAITGDHSGSLQVAPGGLVPPGVWPKAPEHDAGGMVAGRRGSRQLIIAHGGERVLPTHRMSLDAALADQFGIQTRAPAGAAGGGGGQVHVHVHNHGTFIGDEQKFARYMADVIVRQKRTRGPVAAALGS